MTTRSRGGAPGSAALLLGLTMLLGGCDDGGDDPGEVSPATPAAPTGPTAAISPTPTPPPDPDGCPVDGYTLLTALQANREIFDALHSTPPNGMRDIDCHQGYATAVTDVPPEVADPATVAYEYDPADGTWTAVSAGTDAICTGVVPRRIIPELSGCINS